MERKNILLIVLIVLIAVGIFFIKRFLSSSSNCDKLSYTISSQSIFVGESIQYEDNSAKANNWKWDFGDGDGKSELQSGDYTYNKAGEFTITLVVNGKCTETTKIKVNSLVISSEDTTQKTIEIKGPSNCQVGEAVHFGNNTEGAKVWEWQFGETGKIDRNEQNPTYTYNKPGSYTIVLHIDASKKEGRYKINVTPKPAVATPGAPKPAHISNPELKVLLEKILKGDFSVVYYDMLKKYFCNNDHVKVVVNGVQNNTVIYDYCMELDFQRNIKISDVKVTYENDCISLVTITQK